MVRNYTGSRAPMHIGTPKTPAKRAPASIGQKKGPATRMNLKAVPLNTTTLKQYNKK